MTSNLSGFRSIAHGARQVALRFTITLAAAAVCTACSPHADAQTGASSAQSSDSVALQRDLQQARAATASFRVLDSAVAAGYSRDVPRCLAHAHHGAMGYHHANRALMDGRVELEHPEILTYARTPDGQYKLTGLEYVVPYSAVPRDAKPPTVLGQALKPSDPLKIWYLHVWLWEENPEGLFADWNPNVKC